MSHGLTEVLLTLGMSWLQNRSELSCEVGMTWAECVAEGPAWLRQLYPEPV